MCGSIATHTKPIYVLMSTIFTLGDVVALFFFIMWETKNGSGIVKKMGSCHEKSFVLGIAAGIALIFFLTIGASFGLLGCTIIFFIFSFYLSLDMRLIVLDKYKSEIGIDSELYAAVKLYIDIIGIFLILTIAFNSDDD